MRLMLSHAAADCEGHVGRSGRAVQARNREDKVLLGEHVWGIHGETLLVI